MHTPQIHLGERKRYVICNLREVDHRQSLIIPVLTRSISCFNRATKQKEHPIHVSFEDEYKKLLDKNGAAKH